MFNLIMILSKDNALTNVYLDKYGYQFITLRKEETIKAHLNYFDCYVVSDHSINPDDWCIITDTEGLEYPEECDRIMHEDRGEVFYGKNGTRCLVCDAQKILSSTYKALQPFVPAMSEALIMSLLVFREELFSEPNF